MNMTLPPGKVPIDFLKEIIFKNLGVKRKEVAVGPAAGIDCSVLDIDDRSLVVSMDPITGALERIGWEAVNINANDVSTFGVEPAFYLSCILLPRKADKKTIKIISRQMNRAAEDLNMAIVGGHCETTPGLANPVVVGCAMGITERGKYITAAEAKTGDKIIMTKTAGIEGTAILSSDRKESLGKSIAPTVLKRAREFHKRISVVRDALIAVRTGGVHAMHDATEGGIAGGVHEIADASALGFRIFEEEIPVAEETRQICLMLDIDPLSLIASGSMLIAAEQSSAPRIKTNLENNRIVANVIGEFLPSSDTRLIVRKNNVEERLAKPKCDHLWIALAKKTQAGQ